MPRYIDADALRKKMYHEAFETDSDDQRWDSGCWIRYKMFERIIEQMPTADVVEIVRCKDCKHLSEDRIAPEWQRICRWLGVGKSDEGYCDECKRKGE